MKLASFDNKRFERERERESVEMIFNSLIHVPRVPREHRDL